MKAADHTEGQSLINTPPSLLISLRLSASLPFSGAGPHLELFKSEMTSTAPITILKTPSLPPSLLPLLLPSPAHSRSWPSLSLPFFFFFLLLCLHVHFIFICLFLLVYRECIRGTRVVMCQDLIHYSCTSRDRACTDAQTRKPSKLI